MSQRIRSCLGAFACALLLLAPGCQKDRSQPPGAPEASRPIVRQERPKPASSLPLRAWSPNTEALFGIDVAQFRKTPLGQLVNGWLRTVVAAPDGCGARVIEQVGQVLVVMERVDDHKPIYVLAGVSRRQASDCLTHASTWLDDHTLVLAPEWEQAALDALVASSARRTNPRVLAAAAAIDTGAALWVAAARAPDSKGWSDDFDEMRGTIALAGGLRASFQLRYHEEQKAADAAEEFERSVKNLQPFTQYFEVARAHADGTWLQTHFVMSRDQLARFAADPLFSAMFPAQPKS